MVDPINLSRPPLRYHGSKFRLADWLIPHFPPHKTYCEPFAGGFSVGLQKPPSHYEVYNDLDGEVVNFFRILRERPAELIRAIQLTPYSRQEWRDAVRPSPDPVDRARCLYVRCWMSYGSGTGKSSTGWRFHVGRSDDDRSCVTREFSSTDHLWDVAARLKEIQIECDDGLTIIERYDSPQTLFYVDPPYVHSTRYKGMKNKGYRHEMDDSQHIQLAERLHAVRGMVALSGYPSGLYARLYRDWTCVETTTRALNTKIQNECLWLNPAAISVNSLPLFQGKGS